LTNHEPDLILAIPVCYVEMSNLLLELT